MVYLENNEGYLFRGYGRGNPVERWDEANKRFVPYAGGPKPEGWAEVISAERALELMEI